MRDLSHSVRVGFSFGLTSGVITTLGLLVGVSKGTGSRAAVLAGILTIAVADSFSDAMGIHMAEETEGVHSPREIWISTLATFGSKFVMALTFAVPVILLPLDVAVIVAIVWGALTLTFLSIELARNQGVDFRSLVAEHLTAAALVVVAAYLVGLWVRAVFE
jgi:VIT1/CCC1 family predicted Fe2+/Mn2+ transporter